ncbi:MAG: Holliday junction resolvase RuvX [Flavobacteriaceae bacterium]|nr:Holliday junction resolvase RuvX [Flavobacteriaceae bacterium]
MSIILGIDYGVKRTGLAVTDPLKIIASSLRTIETKFVLDYLFDFYSKNEIDMVVIGLPRQKDNTDSLVEKKIKKFIYNLKKRIPDINIDRYDERYTSKIAMKTIIESGVRKKKRKDKGLIDSISATILLQSYINYRLKL